MNRGRYFGELERYLQQAREMADEASTPRLAILTDQVPH